MMRCILKVTCVRFCMLRHSERAWRNRCTTKPFESRLKTWLLYDFMCVYFFFTLCLFHSSHQSFVGCSSCRSSVWIVRLAIAACSNSSLHVHFLWSIVIICCNASKYTIMSKKTPWWFNYLLLFFKHTRYLIRFQYSRRQQFIHE